ncbi:DUF58 domain-containing protein [Haloarcula litorea]|uniref:DUF58 domain-containing protein n=1 Tax=Haloarcula litorea TaxID=3032579 RepID=UPI0023E88C86|nr:DUF58 domain-containing protein [Halomicroarcula sp. GDY20]
MTDRRRPRRAGALGTALVTGAVGLAAGNAAVFVAATVPLVYAAYAAATSDPTPRLTVERSVSPAAPLPGEDVTVTVTVTNDGRDYLPDVRVVDGVPDSLSVVEGTPRLGTALDAGESAAVEYTVVARRGEHAFGGTTVACRDLAGTTEVRERVAADSLVECGTSAASPALSADSLPRAGRVPTSAGGEGVAFYGIREYQSTDSMRRIDWNRFARTSELATVEYRETTSATVVVLVDTRHPVAASAATPTAVELCRDAAQRLAAERLDEDDRVGAATFDGLATLRPRADRGQYRRIRAFLDDAVGTDAASTDRSTGRQTAPTTRFAARDHLQTGETVADGGEPSVARRSSSDRGSDGGEPSVARRSSSEPRSDGGRLVEGLDRRLPDGAQVLFCTPLLDDAAGDAAERLVARGHAVTVVSPDVTNEATPGGTLAALDRTRRVSRLRGTLPVVDWDPDEPLATAVLRRAEAAGWSA